MNKIKRLVIINKLSNTLHDNNYKNFHFGSFVADSSLLLPEVDLVIDYIDGNWFAYTTERGVFTTMNVFENYESLVDAIKTKVL